MKGKDEEEPRSARKVWNRNLSKQFNIENANRTSIKGEWVSKTVFGLQNYTE